MNELLVYSAIVTAALIVAIFRIGDLEDKLRERESK